MGDEGLHCLGIGTGAGGLDAAAAKTAFDDLDADAAVGHILLGQIDAGVPALPAVVFGDGLGSVFQFGQGQRLVNVVGQQCVEFFQRNQAGPFDGDAAHGDAGGFGILRHGFGGRGRLRCGGRAARGLQAAFGFALQAACVRYGLGLGSGGGDAGQQEQGAGG